MCLPDCQKSCLSTDFCCKLEASLIKHFSATTSQDPMGKKAVVQKNEKIEKEDIPETQTKDDEKK
jgi:hypothetical protein